MRTNSVEKRAGQTARSWKILSDEQLECGVIVLAVKYSEWTSQRDCTHRMLAETSANQGFLCLMRHSEKFSRTRTVVCPML